MGNVSRKRICNEIYYRYPAVVYIWNADIPGTNWKGHALDDGTLNSFQGEDGTIHEGTVNLDHLINTNLRVSYEKKDI